MANRIVAQRVMRKDSLNVGFEHFLIVTVNEGRCRRYA